MLQNTDVLVPLQSNAHPESKTGHHTAAEDDSTCLESATIFLYQPNNHHEQLDQIGDEEVDEVDGNLIPSYLPERFVTSRIKTFLTTGLLILFVYGSGAAVH